MEVPINLETLLEQIRDELRAQAGEMEEITKNFNELNKTMNMIESYLSQLAQRAR